MKTLKNITRHVLVSLFVLNLVFSLSAFAGTPVENNIPTSAPEATLEIEDWMSDENYFASVWEFEAPEKSLEIETWMADEDFFTTDCTESAMSIENWMSDENYFKAVWEYTETEQDMAIEAWMSK